ncbi:unnamed protein product [Staurois parvus]|uniref:Uncharacterized protein n=1 Tax=Staurois parvus TaxID=386267 RepID=A0ABN9H5I0_9NEOB|nr:unnamed protein product [Staurois parvus]
MRCPWYLFHRIFCVWAKTQGLHDPLLPWGPMTCQSAPGWPPGSFGQGNRGLMIPY